ncbi:hypothetical protein Tco_0951658 [Tanacetum coccineum]|uniref:Reverse transcriptase domain-containing protein n=1 Tax=Tanacetum coccineum TaxID=301880 RepID=A0ABQ5DXJ3_9ASTR
MIPFLVAPRVSALAGFDNCEVKKLKRSRIPIVKVCWNSQRGPEFTWEREDEMKRKESLPSGPDVYGQSLEVLLTQPAASESESHVPDVVSE